MTRRVRMIVTASFISVLCSCYQSSEPLGKPDRGPTDRHLSGDWRCTDPADADHEASLWLIPFGESQYYAEWHEDGKVSRYRAYPTTVRGEPLLNVEELSLHSNSNIGGWVFMRYRLGPDGSLRLFIVSEDALGELKGKAALHAIARRATDDTLYEPFATCTPGNS